MAKEHNRHQKLELAFLARILAACKLFTHLLYTRMHTKELIMSMNELSKQQKFYFSNFH